MDIGVHILGSVNNTENGLPGQIELGVGSNKDRSTFDGEDSLQRSSKLARTTIGEEDFSSSKTMPFHQGIPLMRSASSQEHMLSFSDKPEALESSIFVGLDNTSNKTSLSPLLHQIPPSYFRTSGGYGCGGMMMNMSMQGKGPFTLTQWAELEQQALIYKYITANVPVPSTLLVSIKKSFYPYGSLPPTSSFGWGTFHLGFAGGNMDPEPGRCRRTDGKKWRCSRDAVPDQKYCERHINRGRHRSRKLVEVQSGKTAVTQPQQARRPSNRSLATGSQYINPSTDSLPNNRVPNPQGPSVKHRNNNNNNPFEFGHISSDSLLNPSVSKTYGSSFLDFSSNQDKNSENNSNNTWHEEMKSDWTQLSMSIPIAPSSPSSTHNNSVQEKLVLSPLRLSREFEPSMIQSEETLEPTAKKGNSWIPISWGNSLGGPLGEVLNSRTNSPTLGPSPNSTFSSLSNSTSVSSPSIAENNRNNGDYYFLHSTCN